ncbi:Uncharacterised protein [Yersinia intermedia]|nr:Uncharacterised protein [Yersinia intermedia]
MIGKIYTAPTLKHTYHNTEIKKSSGAVVGSMRSVLNSAGTLYQSKYCNSFNSFNSSNNGQKPNGFTPLKLRDTIEYKIS